MKNFPYVARDSGLSTKSTGPTTTTTNSFFQSFNLSVAHARGQEKNVHFFGARTTRGLRMMPFLHARLLLGFQMFNSCAAPPKGAGGYYEQNGSLSTSRKFLTRDVRGPSPTGKQNLFAIPGHLSPMFQLNQKFSVC